ncbi:MAG: ATP-binding cassette domain-containing protein [Fibrobacter sp.]|nr:ATP-binding cassette domain-containing protein [Fibrobacter sp.]
MAEPVECRTGGERLAQNAMNPQAGNAMNPQAGNAPAIAVRDWRVRFAMRNGVLSRVTDYFTAVDGVSFTLEAGKILAVVGESGCGKSTLVKSLVGLVDHDAGEFELFGEKVDFKSGASMKRVRNLVQMIFQDPFSSLNPRQTVTEILTAPLAARGVALEEARARALSLLDRVSIPAAAMDKFPHEFSGGQRQRLCIARSLMVEPKVLLCDEVTSALDVSVQAQILHLLDDLRNDLGLSIVFISHDMQVVRALSDDVLVMYFGHVVERGNADEVLTNPQHEYTKKLLASVPTIKR